MNILYPACAKEKTKEHYIKKIELSLLVLSAGVLLTLVFLLSDMLSPPLKDNRVQREPYEGSAKEIPVEVQIGENKPETMDLTVKERLYDETQLKTMAGEAAAKLEAEILGDNESLAHVENDLDLIASLPGYPFEIDWESQDYSLIDTEGKLRQEELPEEGELTGLNAIFTYEKFRAEYLFYVHIYPRALSKEEKRDKKLLAALEAADKASETEEALLLPVTLDGEKVKWSAKKNMQWLKFFLLSVCAAVSVYFLKDEDLKKEIRKRERQMRLDYPEMISKLSIYLGAGMTLRTAWEKIVSDYEKKGRENRRRYLYEEMGIACQEMKSGISESAAYDRFGARCGQQLYRKLSTLLIQNLRKGSTSLGRLLKEESRNAFEDRKNAARKAGEEAGTKLLLPMMMMLCVVMLMILLPAFMTF